MSLRTDKSNVDLTKSSSKKTGEKDKHKKSHSRTDSAVPKLPEKFSLAGIVDVLSPRSRKSVAVASTLSSKFDDVLKTEIMQLEKKEYPHSVRQFRRFLEIYRRHGEDTKRDILNNKEIIEKIAGEMIATFFLEDEINFKSDLANHFILKEVTEGEIKHFPIIFMNEKIKERLKKKKYKLDTLEEQVTSLCDSIKEKLKKPTEDMHKKTESRSKILETPESPKKTADDASTSDEAPLSTIGVEVPAPVIPQALPLVAAVPEPSKPATIYSAESETADKEINVILNSIKKHLERLKEEAPLDPLKKKAYEEVDNLYSKCHTSIKAQQRSTKDASHRSILKSNECVILKKLDTALVAVYKPNDINTISVAEFGNNILTKRQAIEHFESVTKQRSLPKSLALGVAAVSIALGTTVACAAVGALIGIALTFWSGPGAALVAFEGALIGGEIGWAAGILTASLVTGLSVGVIASVFGLFKDGEMQIQLNTTAGALKSVVVLEDQKRLMP